MDNCASNIHLSPLLFLFFLNFKSIDWSSVIRLLSINCRWQIWVRCLDYISEMHDSLHTKELHRGLMKEPGVSCVTVRQTTKPTQTRGVEGGRGGGHWSSTAPNNTGGVSLSVVHPHEAHQGQQPFVWVNPNYSLDRHEKASALTSNTKSPKYKGFHFFSSLSLSLFCFRCQHSRRDRSTAEEVA